MSEQVVLKVTRDFAVPAERVFDAWLDPADAARFLFATPDGEMIRCEIDPRVGGGFTLTERRPTEMPSIAAAISRSIARAVSSSCSPPIPRRKANGPASRLTSPT